MTIKLTTLDSGLRVVTDTMRELETAALGIWIEAGSRNEKRDEQGLSHLLEHMVFKGTQRRSSQAIAEEIETVGGDINGQTTVENTSYTARILAQDTGLALDIIGDILTQSRFEAVELEREKSVVIQEIGEVADMADDMVFERFTEAAYPDQAFGRAILGTPETVSSFSRRKVAGYLDRHYAKPVSVIAAAGAVDHARIVADASKRFAGLSAKPLPKTRRAKYCGGDTRMKRKLEQTHVVIGFEAPSYLDPQTYAANVFSSAVGGGISSRLFQEVREKRGLAYSIYSFNWSWSDTGVSGFHASCSHKDALELANVALDCLAESVEKLTEEELRRARAAMKLGLLTGLESPSARADQIARQVLAYGRVLTRAEIIERVDRLSLADVRAAGRASLRTAPTVSIIGEPRKTPDSARVRERLAGM